MPGAGTKEIRRLVEQPARREPSHLYRVAGQNPFLEGACPLPAAAPCAPSSTVIRDVTAIVILSDPAVASAAPAAPAKTAYVVIGTAGLAALAIALFGPKRLEREVIKPLRERHRAPGRKAVGGFAAFARTDRRSCSRPPAPAGASGW